MLITNSNPLMQAHQEAREGMTRHFNDELEKVINRNSHKRDVYWILGKARVHKKNGVDIIRPFLQECAQKPGLIKESFVYEIDNKRGVKTLLWVMHPGDLLSFPTLGKSIRVAGGSGETILSPEIGRN